MKTYEQRLNEDLNWALREGSMHFEESNAVHQALRKITRKLTELGVPYAVAGGMALFRHGYRRFTEDVDILVTRADLARIHDALEGLGYVPPFAGSKNLRDADLGVRIEFIVAGDYPGDGKPKPVAFPSPTDVSEIVDAVSYLNLASLIELKLASGMSNPRRARDLADVQELIDVLQLSADFGNQLSDYVRDKYHELWRIVQDYPNEA